MEIRRAVAGDYGTIHALVKAAFDQAEHADGNEAELVEELRSDSAYVPADTVQIAAPFAVPRENFMACKLDPAAPAVSGVLQYAGAFGIS